ncbi:NADH-quinone oxidoreductase subunit L [Bacillus thuringiensis]|uniref:Probable inorganic carbon transporter subunit DabB n=1 Tax=Bacillus thuringiensis TaxID=1428 RepID=A0A9X6V3V0_BACTU|nr:MULTISPECIES: NADH dehydrogenase subunit 5 [Bacillus]AJQ59829.1 NADH dehydrogenase [Bacillus thuringiensis serovar morrisoni]AMR85619.1 NADH dehydrogenase [Bacillus thuringiensis]KIP23589.1 NADH-Ubiquinone/plastoquinone (complex I), various chains family protein [Bacillus thuringiensis serovar morrisoni]MBG9639378.1 NADH dehydrogenase [Bacillus thuringiensis]MBG9673604.1 NADH dehydrogenase [Bacillus thuringiensis]
MLISLSSSTLLTLFFMALSASWLSGLLFLHARIPLRFVHIHIGIAALPSLVSLLALVNNNGDRVVGPWHLDTLAWFMAFFVLTIGLIIQRFSVRYLMGDHSYRKYFALFTFTTGVSSVAWLSDDLRLMLICWGATLIGLVLLIGLNKGWKVVSEATKISGYLFTISWIALLSAIIWLFQGTGQWQLTSILTNENVALHGTLERTGINLLIILAVMIPAAQWPFQRWLIESAVAPTPVSAIMHAGLVNAGGIMLTRFSPLFHDDIAQIILLIFSSISILIGTGISLVQVDYKRQLVGSTIAQMGFMLIQCALGAYLAAVIHLILHGLFKATLFLQAGSSVQRFGAVKQSNEKISDLWIMVGRVFGLFIAIAFWFTTSGEGYELVSAFILGWSLYFSWKQLVVFGEGRMGRIVGVFILAGFSLIYFTVHNSLYKWLHTDMYQSVQPSAPAVIFVICILLFSSAISTFVTRNQSSTLFAVLYLWLVRVGEARRKSVESHPGYLKHYVSKGGNS